MFSYLMIHYKSRRHRMKENEDIRWYNNLPSSIASSSLCSFGRFDGHRFIGSRSSRWSHGDGNEMLLNSCNHILKTPVGILKEQIKQTYGNVPPSSAILGAMMVRWPSGVKVEVTISGLTPFGMATRRRNSRETKPWLSVRSSCFPDQIK